VLELLWHAATAATWADSAWTVAGFTSLNAQTLHVTTPAPSVSAVFEGHVLINAGLNVVTGIDTAGTITAGGLLTANGAAVFNDQATFNASHVYLDDDVDIMHTAPQPIRKVQIPLLSGVLVMGGTSDSIGAGTGYDPTGNYLHTTPGTDRIFDYPLVIPRATNSWNVEVLWMTPDASHVNTFTVYKQPNDLDSAVSSPGGAINMGSRGATVFGTGNAQQAALASPITETVEPFNNTYYVRIILKGNAAGTNRLYAVRLVYSDPGPRNG